VNLFRLCQVLVIGLSILLLEFGAKRVADEAGYRNVSPHSWAVASKAMGQGGRQRLGIRH